MKEQLYTIPLNDAVNANDECAFCFIERKVAMDLMDYVLGNASSYMESDIREKTDNAGFCRRHFKDMFDYGNALGNGWILKTHYMRIIKEMKENMDAVKGTPSMKKKFFKTEGASNRLTDWLKAKEGSCFVCNNFDDTFSRYLNTFFYLYKNDSEFKQKILNGKGFCLSHFGTMYEYSLNNLNENEFKSFCDEIFPIMEQNFHRVWEDISWFVDKFDYRNKDADWKNSKDAIQRGMQKLKGGYPADPPYKMSK